MQKDKIIKSELFDNDSVLSRYHGCFSLKPGTLPTKVHLEIDESIPAVVYPPRKIPVALLEPTKQKLSEMEKDGILIKEDEHTPWVSSMVVVDKRKKTNRDINEKIIAVLDRSREVGLKFNLQKKKLRVQQVTYVGHVFTSEGLKLDQEKVQAIQDMPPPSDMDGVLRFL